MWFKQVQLFQIKKNIDFTSTDIQEKLKALAFRPCLPSMPFSIGWVSPVDSDDQTAPLFRTMNSCTMLCLQIEEKILPATVIRHELLKKINKIQIEEDRKVRHSEKLTLKDEITTTLLTRAFSKYVKIYAYIDSRNHRIVLGTANAKRAEQFISLFTKSLNEEISRLDIDKLSPMMTHWLKHQDYPTSFAIEKSCVLQDPAQQSRVIRYQQQNLFTISIESLIKDGCEVKQLAINWQDRVIFVLSDDFMLKSIRYQDEITAQAKEMEPETKGQLFDADFLIMTDVLSQIIGDLLALFEQSKTAEVISLGKTA